MSITEHPSLEHIDPLGLVSAHPQATWNKDYYGVVDLQHPLAQASISAWGGQLLAWQPIAAATSLIWLSDQAIMPAAQPPKKAKAIRGGIPICWPWFADEFPEGVTAPAHGLVRTAWWQLQELTFGQNGISCSWQISDSQQSRAIWPHRFQLILQMELGEKCCINLHITNTDNQAWNWSGALHSYLATNAPQASVRGLGSLSGLNKIQGQQITSFPDPLNLDQPHDHIAFMPVTTQAVSTVQLDDSQRPITIACAGHSSVVVWNISKDSAKNMADVQDQDWLQFACVESAWAGGQTRRIAPYQQQSLSTEISL